MFEGGLVVQISEYLVQIFAAIDASTTKKVPYNMEVILQFQQLLVYVSIYIITIEGCNSLVKLHKFKPQFEVNFKNGVTMV